jgi:hypothetical protein
MICSAGISAQPPDSPVLVIEIGQYIRISGSYSSRYPVNQVAFCPVALTRLYIPDFSSPADLVIVLGPGDLVIDDVRTLDRGVVVEASIRKYDKLRRGRNVDCSIPNIGNPDVDKQECISFTSLLKVIAAYDLVRLGCCLFTGAVEGRRSPGVFRPDLILVDGRIPLLAAAPECRLPADRQGIRVGGCRHCNRVSVPRVLLSRV